jgi:hypothetical protein
MKKLLAILFMTSFSLSAFAFQENDNNFHGGVGVFGSRGIVGFSVDRFFTPNHALSVAFGADWIGATSTVGYKYFTEKTNNSNSIWDKCLFVFECDTHNYYGGGLQYAGASNTKFTESTGLEREYKTDSKWLGMATVGMREVFKNNVTMDFELTYRSIITGGASMQTAGLAADDTKSLESGFRSVGAGVALGYLF